MEDKISFTDLSLSITKKVSKEIKKNEGIFFSSINIVNKTIDIIIREIENQKLIVKDVLEPSCGSCEFINEITKKMSDMRIVGVEKNQIIFEEIKGLKWLKSEIKLLNLCFFEYKKNNIEQKFDLIIGNPPYYTIKKNIIKDLIDKELICYIDGRPNIYILFILVCLKSLNKNGILAFILPNNFLNCQYYNKVRKLIFEEYKIIDIVVDNKKDFLETDQDICIVIIQNTKTEENVLFTKIINNNIIFNSKENILKINKLLENSNHISEIGMNVYIGKIVWNENKEILTDNNEKTRLIYSGDIKNNKLVLTDYKNPLKKNFIDKKGINKPLLLLNRGYGKGKYSFEYAIVDLGNKQFLVENHLICIDCDDKLKLSREKKIELYNKIIKSFNDKRTIEFISLYFGNNAININELENILPIYID